MDAAICWTSRGMGDKCRCCVQPLKITVFAGYICISTKLPTEFIWSLRTGVLPVASGGAHVRHMSALIEIFWGRFRTTVWCRIFQFQEHSSISSILVKLSICALSCWLQEWQLQRHIYPSSLLFYLARDFALVALGSRRLTRRRAFATFNVDDNSAAFFASKWRFHAEHRTLYAASYLRTIQNLGRMRPW